MIQAIALHKTLFRSLNIINVVPGRFYPQKETHYLFNLGTSFEIFHFEGNSLKSESLVPTGNPQCLFSKACYICIGPKIEDVDTFFVIRESDFIHFKFSPDDSLFVAYQSGEFPPDCITPNFAHYEDDQLIISCFHGGLCVFDVSISDTKKGPEIIFNSRFCNSVLHSFPCYKHCFFRIETGPTLAFYKTKPFSLESRKDYTYTDRKILYSFPFGFDSIIICTNHDITCQSLNADTPITFPNPYPFEFIIHHCSLSSSDALLLTKSGKVFRLKSDLSLSIIYPNDNKFTPLRIFSLDGNNCIIVNKCHDHIILNVDNLVERDLQSTVGLQNLMIFNPSRDSVLVESPQIFSYIGPNLLIYRQGKSMTLLESTKLFDIPTNMFEIEIDGKFLLILSFRQHNCSKLIEVKENKGHFDIVSSELPFCEDEETIATAHLHEKFFKISPNRMNTIPGKDTRPHTNPVKYFVSNNRQLLFFSDKPSQNAFEVICRESRDNIKVDSYTFDIKKEIISEITCTALSPPNENTGMSEYLVIGHKIDDKYALKFLFLSNDEPERVYLIDEPFPKEIVSIEFYRKTDTKPLGILVGLASGALIIGDVNFEAKEIKINQSLQLGTLPCKIKLYQLQANRKPLYFGLSTRLCLLEPYQNVNMFKIHPFNVNSPRLMSLCSRAQCKGRTIPVFIIISANILSFYKMANYAKINPDYSLERINMEHMNSLNNQMSNQMNNGMNSITLMGNKLNNLNGMYGNMNVGMNSSLDNIGLKIIGINMIDILKSSNQNHPITVPTKFMFIFTNKDVRLFNTDTSQYEILLSFEDEIITQKYYSKYALGHVVALVTYNLKAQSRVPILRIYSCIISNPTRSTNSSQGLELNYSIRLEPIIACMLNHPVNAISVFRVMVSKTNDQIVVVTGYKDKILVYKVEKGKLALLTSSNNIGTNIKSLSLVRFENQSLEIYVVDEQRSVKMLHLSWYGQISPPKLECYIEEGALRPVTSIVPGLLQVSQQQYRGLVCGGDKLGNFFIFEVKLSSTNGNGESKIFNGKCKFLVKSNVHIGEVITGVCSAEPEGSAANEKKVLLSTWYSTIGGSLGCLLTFFQINRRLLSLKLNYLVMIEHDISSMLLQLTKCDTVAFRSKNYSSATPCCDMDIVEMFLSLPQKKKEEIVEHVNSEIRKENKNKENKDEYTVEGLESDIYKFLDYFWIWN